MSRLEGSGPNIRSWGSSFLLNSVRFSPGWTRTHFSSTFSSRIRFMRPHSRMIPSPTAEPVRLVPAARGVIGTPVAIA